MEVPAEARGAKGGSEAADVDTGGEAADVGSAKAWIRLSDEDAALVRSGGRVHLALGGSAGVLPLPGAQGAADSTCSSGEGVVGRFITVLGIGGRLRAFDSVCYHAGGPLGLGDIEEAGEGGRPCIRCPWHHYLVDLETGSKWHQPLQKDASGKLVPVGWKASEKPVQRIHEVVERPDGVFVRLRLEGTCESDWWAHREDCFRPMSGPAPRQGGSLGADGRLPSAPSGHVLQQGAQRRLLQRGGATSPGPLPPVPRVP